MAVNRIGSRIEALIRREEWREARRVIEECLRNDPEDHWLWGRLAAVKYEQRDYQGALKDAEKALKIVPDCPLALWSKATALEMLGNVRGAMGGYASIFNRGLKELKDPDEDANECWEGAAWTSNLVAHCLFRTAGCLVKIRQQDKAIKMYQDLITVLSVRGCGIEGIDLEDVTNRLSKLMPNERARREAVLRIWDKEEVMAAS